MRDESLYPGRFIRVTASESSYPIRNIHVALHYVGYGWKRGRLRRPAEAAGKLLKLLSTDSRGGGDAGERCTTRMPAPCAAY